MESTLTPVENLAPLTANAVRANVKLIQEVMKEVMQDGQHYGKIPGCGDKPTLLKPGAEKLSMVFRLRPIIDNDRDINIEDLGDGHREIRVYCHVLNMAGVELATGVGSCSTKESKFRYRGGEKVSTGQPVPKEYWNLKKAGKLAEAKQSIGGEGYGVAKIEGNWEICEIGEKMENSDIADTYNTVLKMAKKRAYVDGILSATAASDIFTQDIEDLPTAAVQASVVQPANGKPSVQQPQEKKSDLPLIDLITLQQSAKAGDHFDVVAYFQSVNNKTYKKKDKVGNVEISEYTVADLPNDPTISAIIKTFGEPAKLTVGDKVKFSNVEVLVYEGKLQFVGKKVEKNV